MPIQLPESLEHTRNFVDAVKAGARSVCDIETAMRSDMLCQLASMALKAGRKLEWDPVAETFGGDAEANALLEAVIRIFIVFRSSAQPQQSPHTAVRRLSCPVRRPTALARRPPSPQKLQYPRHTDEARGTQSRLADSNCGGVRTE